MKVRVITGGPGIEREGSLASGRDVAAALRALGYETDVVDLIDPRSALSNDPCDFAFLTTHGWYGEDGKLQGALDLLGIPYLGSGVTASAIAMHKPSCLRIAASLGIACPSWTEVDSREDYAVEAQRITQKLGPKVFIKPCSGGGSLGAGVADDVLTLHGLLSKSGKDQPLLASQYMRGVDVSVALIQRGSSVECLPVLATFHDSSFYDYVIKHDAALRRHECPARIAEETREKLERSARLLFATIKCTGFARFDFILDEQGQAWFLEVNTLPGMSRAGNLSTMADASGLTYPTLLQILMDTLPTQTSYRA